MKLREADTFTQLIMSDDWHSANGEYDHKEDEKFFVIEYNHPAKKVTVYDFNGVISTYDWKGTKDSMTNRFRTWLHKTVNDSLMEGK